MLYCQISVKSAEILAPPTGCRQNAGGDWMRAASEHAPNGALANLKQLMQLLVGGRGSEGSGKK
jgi:hypothetical protein